jgi:hypothetical protein
MLRRLYKGDLLRHEEREAYETDLIAFCDRELDLLGDIRDLDVLYAGGSSLLWLEGLSQRIGGNGTLIALEANTERVEEGRQLLREADLAAAVRIVAGNVFQPPFERNTFSLAYSAGLFHELDVRDRSAEEALTALAAVVRSGGRVATSDFVDSVPAAQLDEEELQGELAREISGTELYGIGSPDRLVALHETRLVGVRGRVTPPHPVRHLDKIILAEEEPQELQSLPAQRRRILRERREALRERIEREGYTRPATLYVEGIVTGS